jgi:hypothetical protein
MRQRKLRRQPGEDKKEESFRRKDLLVTLVLPRGQVVFRVATIVILDLATLLVSFSITITNSLVNL